MFFFLEKEWLNFVFSSSLAAFYLFTKKIFFTLSLYDILGEHKERFYLDTNTFLGFFEPLHSSASVLIFAIF